MKSLGFWGPSKKALYIKDLRGPPKIRADFTASSAACQPRATLQICNEKALALVASILYIRGMETQETIVQIGNALYAQVNGLIVRFIGMVS